MYTCYINPTSNQPIVSMDGGDQIHGCCCCCYHCFNRREAARPGPLVALVCSVLLRQRLLVRACPGETQGVFTLRDTHHNKEHIDSPTRYPLCTSASQDRSYTACNPSPFKPADEKPNSREHKLKVVNFRAIGL